LTLLCEVGVGRPGVVFGRGCIVVGSHPHPLCGLARLGVDSVDRRRAARQRVEPATRISLHQRHDPDLHRRVLASTWSDNAIPATPSMESAAKRKAGSAAAGDGDGRPAKRQKVPVRAACQRVAACVGVRTRACVWACVGCVCRWQSGEDGDGMRMRHGCWPRSARPRRAAHHLRRPLPWRPHRHEHRRDACSRHTGPRETRPISRHGRQLMHWMRAGHLRQHRNGRVDDGAGLEVHRRPKAGQGQDVCVPCPPWLLAWLTLCSGRPIASHFLTLPNKVRSLSLSLSVCLLPLPTTPLT